MNRPALKIVRAPAPAPEGYVSLNGEAKRALAQLDAANRRLQLSGAGSYVPAALAEDLPRQIDAVELALKALRKALP